MIKLRDALAIMATRDNGGEFIPFSFTVTTCDLKNKTGGLRRSYSNARLASAGGKKNALKNANHYPNWTRNVYVPGKSRPITIQALLITEFNGERVFP